MARANRSTFTMMMLLAVAAPTVGVAAGAQPEAHEHAHHHQGTPLVARLQVDQGKPWPTDAALREGMAAIHSAFETDHARIHAGQQTDAQYGALATSIETQVNRIVAQCKLPPDADAQLHYVVGDLLQGVAWMRGQDAAQSRHDGAARVHGALRAYAKHFDDAASAPSN